MGSWIGVDCPTCMQPAGASCRPVRRSHYAAGVFSRAASKHEMEAPHTARNVASLRNARYFQRVAPSAGNSMAETCADEHRKSQRLG